MSDKTLGITTEMDIDDVISGLDQLISRLGDVPDTVTADINLGGEGAAASDVENLKTDLNDIDNMTATPTIDVGGDTNEITTAENEMHDLDGMVATPDINIDAGAIEEAAAAASALGDYLEEDAGAAENLSGGLDRAAGSADETADSTSNVNVALGGFAALGIGAMLDSAVNSAGEFNDSWSRLADNIGEGGVAIEQVKAEWTPAINEMTAATGRGAGDVRQAISSLGMAGVTSKDVIQSSFEVISGASFNTGRSVESITQSFDRVVASGNMSSRTLMQLGLNSQDVYNATGLSVEQVSQKLKEMDPNARAAYLSMIMGAKDGTTANEAYKNSWQHVQDQMSRALGYASRIAGAFLLPGASAALTTVSGVLSKIADAVDGLPGPIKSVLGGIMGVVGGVVVLSAAFQAVKKVWDAINLVNNIKGLKAAIEGVPASISKISSAIGKIPEVPGKVNTSLSKIKTAASSAASTVTSKLSGAISKIKSVPGTVVTSFSKVKTAATDVAGTVTSKLGSAITKLKGVPGAVISSFNTLKNAITGATVATDANTAAENRGIIAKTRAAAATAAKAAKEAISTTATKIATVTQAAFNAVMDMNPIMLVVIAIAALAAGFIYLYTHVKSVRDAVNNFWNQLKGFWGWLTSIDPNGVWKWLWGGIQDAINKVKAPIEALINFLKELPGKMANFGRDMIQGLIRGITGAIPGLNGVLGRIANLIPHSPAKEGPLSTVTPAGMESWGSGLATAGTDGFSELQGGLSSTLNTAAGTARSGLSTIQGTVQSFAGDIQSTISNMFSMGQSMISNLASGLSNGIPDLTSVFNQIVNFFPHSPPREGPLATIQESEMEKWGSGLAVAGARGVSQFAGYMNSMLRLPGLPRHTPSMAGNLPAAGVAVYVEEGAVQINGKADENVVRNAGETLGQGLADRLSRQANTAGRSVVNVIR